MDFSFTQEQEMWRNMLQDFTEKEAGREYTRDCDLEKRFPQHRFSARMTSELRAFYRMPQPDKLSHVNAAQFA